MMEKTGSNTPNIFPWSLKTKTKNYEKEEFQNSQKEAQANGQLNLSNYGMFIQV